MYGLAIFPLLPVKNGVFVFGQHFLLFRHYALPSLYGLRRDTFLS